MKEFFDTSVLVAAFWGGHRDHRKSLAVFRLADKKKSACSAHTLAEVYATMTALPVKDVIPPDQALLFIQEVRERLTIVGLTGDDFSAIEQAAKRGFTSGMIYDALLLRCAAKINAETISTWNLKHFRHIDPELAGRMRTP